jgi:hypothetical protein
MLLHEMSNLYEEIVFAWHDNVVLSSFHCRLFHYVLIVLVRTYLWTVHFSHQLDVSARRQAEGPAVRTSAGSVLPAISGGRRGGDDNPSEAV